MDMEKTMVLIKGEDKTASVEAVVPDPLTGKTLATYRGGRSYAYLRENVEVFENPRALDLAGKAVYVNGLPVYAPRLLLDFTSHLRILGERGSSRTAIPGEVELVEDAASQGDARQLLGYFREIASHTGEGESFLQREMEGLSFVHPESVLARYLDGQPVEGRVPAVGGVIFPFRFNLSQKAALENALAHSVSVIEGPPGTGKTQTILNILANLVTLRGKSVAVVSNNNEAVKNVIEKMAKGGYGFLTALLGNQENQKAFFANPPAPQVEGWDCPEDRELLLEQAAALGARLDALLQVDRERAQLTQELQAWQLEQEHFEEYYRRQEVKEVEKLPLLRASGEKILAFLAETTLAQEQGWGKGLLHRLKMFLKYRGSFQRLRKDEAAVLLQLERAFYKKQIQALEDAAAGAQRRLEGASFP